MAELRLGLQDFQPEKSREFEKPVRYPLPLCCSDARFFLESEFELRTRPPLRPVQGAFLSGYGSVYPTLHPGKLVYTAFTTEGTYSESGLIIVSPPDRTDSPTPVVTGVAEMTIDWTIAILCRGRWAAVPDRFVTGALRPTGLVVGTGE
ncbi:hypothetical protein GOBAR_DD33848 [Gossypium barbadense]|nr:hypothetical protein GOBAR_DD33848 [Gossypium barbadense]